MNKSELVAAVAAKAELSKADAKKAVDAFIATVGETLKKGDKVALVGFGTFEVAKRPARTGINPRTKEPIQIKAKNIAKFKAGSELNAAVE